MLIAACQSVGITVVVNDISINILSFDLGTVDIYSGSEIGFCLGKRTWCISSATTMHIWYDIQLRLVRKMMSDY